MIETHPLDNFVPNNIQYLLLGSFTANSFTSDNNYDWYYGSKRNQFWPIIEEVYDVQLKDTSSRQKLFSDLGLGVADIIYQCERKQGNSMDNNLINIVYNPKLEAILKNCGIKKVFFSSRYVEKLYKKVFKHLVEECPSTELITLPSPSPRYAAMSRADKVKRYKELLPKKG
jgi:hypoxanthine-DNA glycosylase